MTKARLLAVAAIVASVIASPALAQSTTVTYRDHDARVYHRDSGFWPVDVAAGIVGGAVSTAGAIATAPFRNDSYAYYGGPRSTLSATYATRNGFVCRPGTRFRGEDGLMHICQ